MSTTKIKKGKWKNSCTGATFKTKKAASKQVAAIHARKNSSKKEGSKK
jgi:hypothetical protein